jgi:hypothetical protein
MERQNITLSIPKNILQKVKLLAVKQGTSVSTLMARVLEDIVSEEEGYKAAQLRHQKLIKKGFDLGTHGSIPFTRDDLHAR